MSLPNPNLPVTEERLQQFYHRIKPYMGGSADAGFTPVGSVIAIMGVTAPANYLACNGQIVNVADYPELANYFEQQFGTKYKFGGSGTTFGIPDLRGEFLRGTGTNSRTNQGSGSAVGNHQDATEVPIYTTNNAETALIFSVHSTGSESTKPKAVNKDSEPSTGDTFGNLDFKSRTSGSSPCRITTRPTNTSILWCIATKDIYLNPAMDYSTDEKVVGKWIDGKPLYERTIVTTLPTVATDYVVAHKDINVASYNVDTAISLSGMFDNGNVYINIGVGIGSITFDANVHVSGTSIWYNKSDANINIEHNRTGWSARECFITFQYTKSE